MPTPLCTSSPHRMSLTHFLLLLLSWPFHQAVLGHPSALHKRDNSRNVPSLGFYDPHSNGWPKTAWWKGHESKRRRKCERDMRCGEEVQRGVGMSPQPL